LTSADGASVVIPCHNSGRFLAQAIESALGQTVTPADVTVVDDGSTDETAEVAERYDVTLVRQRQLGVSIACNRGFAEARGGYALFLDADDELVPDALENLLARAAANPEAGLVYGHQQFVGEDGAPIAHRPDWATLFTTCLDEDPYRYALRTGHPIRAPGATLYRSAAVRAVGGHQIDRAQDLDLNLRISREFPVLCADVVVLRSRIHGANQIYQYGSGLRSAVLAHQRQRAYVREHPEYQAEYRSGLRVARRYWGSRLADQIVRQARCGDWPAAAGGLRYLVRYAPAEGARLVVRRARRLVTRAR
jgi:glycosyltransferase involved in cell wall biosynthesis